MRFIDISKYWNTRTFLIFTITVIVFLTAYSNHTSCATTDFRLSQIEKSTIAGFNAGDAIEDSASSSNKSQLGVITKLPDRILLSGSIAGESRWERGNLIISPDKDESSDLYIRFIELAVEANFLDWATSIAVLNSEWIGDYVNQGDGKAYIDEIHFDLKAEKPALYMILGKRTQPFGLFENDMISDPMTQNGYETRQVGLTLGYQGKLNSDISCTIYKGQAQMDQLFGADLFDTSIVKREDYKVRNVNSFIVSGLISPSERNLTIFGGILSEPGLYRRNSTANIGASIHMPYVRNLLLDFEYMKALNRDSYLNAPMVIKEGILSATVSWLFSFREKKAKGSGNYSARKLQLHTHPIMISLRLEHFDDDSMFKTMHCWSVRDRYSVSNKYTFHDDHKVFVYLMSEYRYTNFRVDAIRSGQRDENNHEVLIRLGLDF